MTTPPDLCPKCKTAKESGYWTLVIIGSGLLTSYSLGYFQGRSAGTRIGVDAVMCAMDRLANSHPVGGRGPSDYCWRVDAARDARS